MENLWQDEKEISEDFAEAFRNGEGAWHPNFEKMLEWWLHERREAMEKVLIRVLADLHTMPQKFTESANDHYQEGLRDARHILKDYLLTLQEKDVR